MKTRTTYHKDEDGTWFYIMQNGNFRGIGTGYPTKKDAKRTVNDIKTGVKSYKNKKR